MPLILDGTSAGGSIASFLNIDDTNGRVGIGTTSPSTTFHVSGDNPRARFTDTPNSVNFDIFMGDDNATVGMQTNHSLKLMTNDAERMRIDSNGDIFIGTLVDIAPSNRTILYISDGTLSQFGLQQAGSYARKFSIGNSGTYFNLYD